MTYSEHTPSKAFQIAWSDELQTIYDTTKSDNTIPGRVSVSHGYLGTAWTPEGEINYSVAGRLRLDKNGKIYGQPIVGDWIILRKAESENDLAMVTAILTRKTLFSRKIAGNSHKTQAIAANVDTIFITSSMNREFNIRRIERYLALVTESKANPVIVLTKSDLGAFESDYFIDEIRSVNKSVPIHLISVKSKTCIEELNQYLLPGRTVALVGSSGVGKSTLINYWLGEEVLRTNEIRLTDDRGRHTTTHRELFCMPNGTLVIDTPGMRELQLLDKNEGLLDAFDDIRLLSLSCKFSDCKHTSEPGCSVLKAIETGELDEERLDSFLQLADEISQMQSKGKLNISTGLKKTNAFSRSRQSDRKKRR